MRSALEDLLSQLREDGDAVLDVQLAGDAIGFDLSREDGPKVIGDVLRWNWGVIDIDSIISASLRWDGNP
jgi:hypothetical protein